MLAMYYSADSNLAFDSVMHLMRDVKNGWIIRYAHSNGASMIFILLYIHIGKGLYYNSYNHNRRGIWWSGLLIFILMMGTAFIGYVLPWGQMSYWGATVITNLITAIPFVGENITHWLWGGFSVGAPTLSRLYSFHYLLPFLIVGLIGTHLVLLHEAGSSNPEQNKGQNFISFYPYFFWKDLLALNMSLVFFVYLVFLNPNYLGHPDNWIKANPLVTPAHIVPEWYFTPFYAILRACPNKTGGVIGMAASLLVLFLIPLYNEKDYALPTTLSPYFKFFYWQFVAVFLILMFLGGKPAVYPYVFCSKIFTLLYFIYFLVILPFRHKVERNFIITSLRKSNQIVTIIRAIWGQLHFSLCKLKWNFNFFFLIFV